MALTLRIRTFLTPNGHPFKYLDLDRDPDVRHLLDRFGVNPADIPVLICRRQAVLVVEAAGHQVRKAFDGRSGISAALEYQPDLILLDVGMPDMNGTEVAKELRRHREVAGARIVALTGWGQAEDRQRTADAGFDADLTKPAEPAQIQRILEEVAVRLRD